MKQLQISNQPIAFDKVSLREVSFGSDRDLTNDVYEITINRHEFLERCSSVIQAGMDDLREDYEATGDTSFHKVIALGFPSPENLLEHPAAFRSFIMHKVPEDVIRSLLADSVGESKWVLNSLDEIEIRDEEIVFSGTAYPQQK